MCQTVFLLRLQSEQKPGDGGDGKEAEKSSSNGQHSNSDDTKYLLHAVLVHSGDNHGGHYVVFINPK